MRVEPSLEDVEARYRAGQPTVVWTRLVADLETPVSAMLKLCDGKPNSFLLESVEGGAVRGRYSLIGLQPDLIWRCHGDKAEINRQARFDASRFESVSGGAIASLRALIEESKIELPAGLPPMAAGLFGYLGYDMVRLMEKLPDIQPDKLGLPDGVFLRPTIMAVFDNVEDIVTVVTPVRPQAG
ncbi:MAG: anthranilate synthase component I, partial [Hypericibacter sp.]